MEGEPFRAVSTILIEGELDAPRLQRAVEQLVSRHEILRTTFNRPPGIKIPFQVISDKPQLSLTLTKRSEDSHLLVLSLPSLCADSATLTNLTAELSRAYASALEQDEPIQYADFAEWQHELLEADNDGASYWRTVQAASLPTVTLPLEKRVAQPRSFSPDSIAIDLSSHISKIEALAAETSVSTILLACWHALLWRLAGETESSFLLYALSTGRQSEDLANALGLYAKYLPIGVHCEDGSFTAHLRRISNALQAAEEWQEYFDPGASANIASSIAYEFEERQARHDAGGLSFSVIDQHACIDPFKLKLSCVHSGPTLSARLHYDKQVFDTNTVQSIAGYFERFLSGVLENSQTHLSDIEIIDAGEHRRLTVELNQTAAPEFVVNKTVHELFEAQVSRTPTALALVSGDQRLTYEGLNSRANQLAHLLRRHGVGPDVCVGLCVERSAEMIVGLLGILKAGGAYVPLNPDHPRERLALQLAESKAHVLITSGPMDQVFDGATIDLHRDRALLDAESNHNPPTAARAENFIYVIYTSGSTGIPKGVAVRHENLINYTQYILQRLKVAGPLSFATVSTISADLGNTCVFPALLSGGCLHVIGYEASMEGDLLRDYFIKHRIEVLKIVPSHLSTLLATQTDGGMLPAKYLILGGEALTWDLVQNISRFDHTCQIINHYGPTETTVGSLTYSVDEHAASPYSSTLPIGRPIANTRCYILDRRQRPVPFGVAGELHIGGAGVAYGYLNQPAETEARFLPDPFTGDSEGRMYRTGDLVRYLPDNNIEFLGRVDHQVKVRGFRVELAEIEAVLSNHAGVRQAVVTLNRDQTGNERIVAYLVSAPTSPDKLRAALKQKLPDYMVPSVFVFLKSLPLTPNGKVDRAALPAPDDTRVGLQIDFVAPRTQIESELAGIWAVLLKLDAVGVHDNFFDLGGHSLLATQVVSRMRKEFQLEIPLRSLFETPTVAGLAEKIESSRADNTARLLADLEEISDDEAARLLGLEKS